MGGWLVWDRLVWLETRWSHNCIFALNTRIISIRRGVHNTSPDTAQPPGKSPPLPSLTPLNPLCRIKGALILALLLGVKTRTSLQPISIVTAAGSCLAAGSLSSKRHRHHPFNDSTLPFSRSFTPAPASPPPLIPPLSLLSFEFLDSSSVPCSVLLSLSPSPPVHRRSLTHGRPQLMTLTRLSGVWLSPLFAPLKSCFLTP